MKPPEDRDRKNNRYLRKLYRYLNSIHSSARDVGDDFVNEHVVVRLLVTSLAITQLLQEFRDTPTATLEEIATRIELSEAALHFRFAYCGIDNPKNLRQPSAHLAVILKQNRVHGALVKLVMDVRGNYLFLREAIDSTNHDELFVDWKEVYGSKDKTKNTT